MNSRATTGWVGRLGLIGAEWGAALSPDHAPPSRLTVFALLFAWANLLHQLSFREWLGEFQPLGLVVFVLSAALCLWPGSFRLFGTLLLARVVYTLSWIPMIRGHLFVEGLLAIGILAALITQCSSLRQWSAFDPVEEEQLFDAFAPFLRWSSLIIYFAVALSKMNWQFIDPQASSAVQFLYWTADAHPWIPTGIWVRELAIWGTLGVEAVVPVLLCFRRTRWVALVAALVFHTLLGLTPLRIASFSLTMFLVLLPWTPRDAPRLWFEQFQTLVRRSRLSPRTFVVLLGCTMFVTGCLYAVTVRGRDFGSYPLYLGLGIWWWQTVIAAVALWTIRSQPGESSLSLLRVRSLLLSAYLVLILFNCLSPYLGLKTRSALAMHCNLRTEKGHWNHLFLPESLRIFSYQDRLVTVLESDLPDFDHLSRSGMALPYFEFRRWCRLAEADFYVVYQDGEGEAQRFEKRAGQGSDPSLMRSQPVLEYFLCFNPVGATHDYIPDLVPRTGPARNVVPHFEVPAR